MITSTGKPSGSCHLLHICLPLESVIKCLGFASHAGVWSRLAICDPWVLCQGIIHHEVRGVHACSPFSRRGQVQICKFALLDRDSRPRATSPSRSSLTFRGWQGLVWSWQTSRRASWQATRCRCALWLFSCFRLRRWQTTRATCMCIM